MDFRTRLTSILTLGALLAALASPALAAEPAAAAPRLPAVAQLLDPASLAAIKAEGRAVRAVAGAEARRPELAPLVAASAALRAAITAEAPSMLVEAAFLLPRPAPADPAAEFSRVYGILRAVSSLQGTVYWSASRKTWRTFYEESWRIDGPATRLKIADGAPSGSPPSTEQIYAWQKDLSFGGNVYRYRYAIHGAALPGAAPSQAPAILVESSNLTRMSYSLIPVMDPEGLKVRLLVVPCAEGILFYAASAARAPNLPGLRGKLEDSFTNRAAALFRWFGERYAG